MENKYIIIRIFCVVWFIANHIQVLSRELSSGSGGSIPDHMRGTEVWEHVLCADEVVHERDLQSVSLHP